MFGGVLQWHGLDTLCFAMAWSRDVRWSEGKAKSSEALDGGGKVA